MRNKEEEGGSYGGWKHYVLVLQGWPLFQLDYNYQGMNRSTFFDRSDPVPVQVANSVPFLVPFHQSQFQFQFQFQFQKNIQLTINF